MEEIVKGENKINLLELNELEENEISEIEEVCEKVWESDLNGLISGFFGYGILKDIVCNFRKEIGELNVQNVMDFLDFCVNDMNMSWVMQTTKVDLTLSITDCGNRGSRQMDIEV